MLAMLAAGQASGTGLHDAAPGGGGTIGQALLEPTVIYVPRILSLADAVPVKVHCPMSCFTANGSCESISTVFGNPC